MARFGDYEIEALVGRGGMADVYRAHGVAGRNAGVTVAVKRLRPEAARDPEYLELFEREAAVTRRLCHPTCIEVIESGIIGGTPYIVMEYVDGKNLRQILNQCRDRGILLPLDFAAFLAHTVAVALAHAHEGVDRDGLPLGILHCDVSPSNVFISRLGEIRLGDFGVALAIGVEQTSGATFGKAHYLAPELILGQQPTPRTDIFALGAMTFELLTNEHPFPGTSMDEVGRAILSGRLRAPSELRPEIPFELDALVLRCIAPEPEDRWPSAAAFAGEVATRYDPSVGTPLAIASVVRGLFGLT
jgi:eukaryotic-like serine/threonine-protein kinase